MKDDYRFDEIKALIFDIKRYATGDGPGIRTIVFLKGCPMRCKWCSNPESQLFLSQIIYYKNKCSKCLKCVNFCEHNAISVNEKYGLTTDESKCILCGKCVDECLHNAREFVGKWMSVNEVMKEIERDEQFYSNTGGGVTISGGEPLLQSEFCMELFQLCNRKNISTAIETCGNVLEVNVKKVLAFTNVIMYDFKHMDSEIHKLFTGCGNEQIIKNLLLISASITNQTLIVRIPYIPTFNDSYDTIFRIFNFLSQVKNIDRVEIMPYHRLGKLKYDGLSREYQLDEIMPIKRDELTKYINLGADFGLNIKVDALG